MTEEEIELGKRQIITCATEILRLVNGEPGRTKFFPGFGDFTRRQIFDLTTQIRVWADQIAFGRDAGEDADDD